MIDEVDDGEIRQHMISQLAFVRGHNWLDSLKAKAKEDKNYRDQLEDATPGLGYCIDERPPIAPTGELKPAFVGGAGGWTVLFMMHGKSLDDAVAATEQLYQKMNWGKMEAHTDDDHGDKTDEAALEARNEGCGFLAKWKDIASITKSVLHGEIELMAQLPDVKGSEIIRKIREKGGKIVPLTGEHKTDEASVVVNFNNGKTLDRAQLYANNPTFLWDAWATTTPEVLGHFNTLANSEWDQDQFMKLQTTLHLATGLTLGALHLDRPNQNLVLLEAPSQALAA